MTLEEAKKLFISSGCSLHGVFRNNGQEVYEEFLRISSEPQRENWTMELLDYLFGQLKETGDYKLFTEMNLYYENLYKKYDLQIMKDAYKYIQFNSDLGRKIIMSCLTGTKDISCRSGLIFWSYDTKQYEVALYFMKEAEKILEELMNSREIGTDEKRYIADRVSSIRRTINM